MAETSPNTDSYHVLARKYRPADFDALIGQEAMVRTLKNAIDAGRLAHAFVLTGVRGVGKTTTARIIAKALNCIGPDGKTEGPTITPCGQCEHCLAIAESRHVDVLEMDAASRTGVDDIREIIDGVRYAAVSARFKIYIIDEVHMLSKNAFNALLKTLEEPPAHVKFIFATTEIRKLPVTVLSRCQRFDLKRVEADRLIAHFASVGEQEGAEVEDAALKLIARAAEGSVRDGLSLLDQAIAHGGGQVGEAAVRDMLGLADRARVLDLFEAVMAGKTAETLAILREQTDLGADPAVVLSDLAEATHWITRLKAVPDAGADALVSEAERAQGGAMAEKLSMPALTRAWQMLLKGITEVRAAPAPLAAAEMVLIRLAYAADLPSPAELIETLKGETPAKPAAAPAPASAAAPTSAPAAPAAQDPRPTPPDPEPADMAAGRSETVAQTTTDTTARAGAQVLALKPQPVATADGGPPHPLPISFEALVALFRDEREGVLATCLSDHVRLVDYAPGKVTLNPLPAAPNDLVMRMKQCLKAWTGQDWVITIASDGGGDTLAQQAAAREAELRAETLADPLVRQVLDRFPGAELIKVVEWETAPVLGAEPSPDRSGDET